MRIDKFLTECGVCTRTEAARAGKLGAISVNGERQRDVSVHIDPEKDELFFRGERIQYRRFTYVMLNKPAGYVSATEDGRLPTVLELVDKRMKKQGLFPCGRLDRDTLGLMILTNDGESAHYQLSPRHHAEKEYLFETALPVGDTAAMEAGMVLEDGYQTLPCRIVMENDHRGVITLTEGKYHQIKRMFEAAGNKITYLERISFAGIRLDPALKRGEWRYLTAHEEALMTARQGEEM